MAVPKPKPKIEFPDPDQYADLADLRKQIREIILDLRTVMRKGEGQSILVEFSSVIHPGMFADPGRLPRDSSTGRSRVSHKTECLYAIISAMIQTYWDLVLMPDDSHNKVRLEFIRTKLAFLKEVKRKSLVLYKVDGDDRRGYTLI